MSNLLTVDLTSGVPTTGTGTVMTLNSIAALLPAALAANGGLKIEGVAGGVVVPVADGGGSLTVDNGGTFAVQATIASGATSIAKAEDVASADADVGVPALAVRKATPANTSGTDGDYEFLQMSAGRLWVDASGKTLTVDGSGVTQPVSLASVPSHAVTNAGTFAVQATLAAGATAIAKAEDVASADADVGVPAMAVRKATPANTSGTDGDYEMLQMSAGRLWVSAVIDTSRTFVFTGTFTPAATSHTAGDVVGGAQTLTLAGTAPAGEVTLTSLQFEIDVGTPEGGDHTLELYNVTPPSAIADDAAFDIASGDRTAHLCSITIPTPVDKGSTQKLSINGINEQITLATAGVLCAYLVQTATGTITAVARKIRLHGVY